jgi:Zn-dependent protease
MPFKVRIHRSFIQLFVILLVLVTLQGRGLEGVGQFVSGFVLLFVTVVVHELSHAMVAKTVGVHVRDIVLHPLGGMTRLDWTAKDPKREALISSAGPAINLVIAALLLGILAATRAEGRFAEWVLRPLFMVNVALGVLNLIPAFPMDGGRILRALLSVRFGHLRATRIAARIGRWIAALALVVPFFAPALGMSFWQSLVFPILGVFVFVLGEIELKQAEALDLVGKMHSMAGRRPEAPGGPPGGGPTVIDVEASSRVIDDDQRRRGA